MTSPDPNLPTVLFVATPAALGGSNRSLVTLLGSLSGKVHRVLASPPAGAFPELVGAEGLADEFVALPRRPGHPMDRWLRLTAGLRIAAWAVRNRRRLAAIHANALTGLNLAAPAALVTRRPTVVWVHDPVGSVWGRRLGPVLRLLLPRLRLAAVSPTAEAVAVDQGLCRPGEAEIIPNPIDPAEVLATDRHSGHPLHIGVVGGASYRKGFDLVPAAIRALADLPVVWRLYVHPVPDAGNAEVWDEIQALPPGLVDVVGKTSDVRGLYGDLDIVFCPSRLESFCRVAAEAMLNGLPVVGSDIPPLRQLLGDDEAGLLFPVGDTGSAVDALRRFVMEPESRDRAASAGRERASVFPPSVVAGRLLDLYGLV